MREVRATMKAVFVESSRQKGVDEQVFEDSKIRDRKRSLIRGCL